MVKLLDIIRRRNKKYGNKDGANIVLPINSDEV
jgi:hypothetical protein